MKFFVKVTGLFIFLLISSVMTFSQDIENTTYRIANIEVSGLKNYDPNTIIAYSGLKVGDEVTIPSDQTKDAISKLWNVGIFSDIELNVERKFGSDVYLVFEVTELPRVESVMITGNREFSEDDLLEKINIRSGEIVSEQRLKDIEYNLEKFYNSEGYPLTDVTVDKLLSANNEARIRVSINEGNKLTVRKIIFQGNSQVSSDDLKGALDELSEAKWWKFWDGAKYDKEKLETDKENLISYYNERGFRDASIVDDEVIVYPGGKDITVKFTVNEGPRYTVNSINFTGNSIYNDSLLRARLGIKRGDVYNIVKLNQNLYGNEAETDISSLYLDNGYLAFTANVDERQVSTNKVDLTIQIDENNQFKFGLISFEGNEKTKDKVLRRELYTIPGDYFNKSNIRRSMQQLAALNYFNPEKLTQDISLSNDSTVNIKYIVEERSSDQFNASIGYSGSFGITGALGLTFNNFDITQPLKGGAGQVLNFNWQFGEGGSYRTFNIGFVEPWLFNTPTTLGFNLFDSRQNYSAYDIRETGGSVSLGRRFKFPDDFFRGDWTLRVQRTNVLRGGDFYQEGIRNQFAIRQAITRSSVFDPVFPSTGTRVVNSTELSGGPFLPGTIEYIKNEFTAEAYTPLFRDRRFVLFSNFNFSFINSLAADNYLPPTEVFFMGGNGLAYNTIALRGYDDRNVGPKNILGNPIGGKVAVKYGIELRYALSLDPLPIFVLAFAEAGNVWSDIKKTDPFDLRRSVGFGTRLLLPAVGLVGFDLGYGFDRMIVDREPPKWLFHFQFGRGF
jgi:outer membrane protein insertion porin family